MLAIISNTVQLFIHSSILKKLDNPQSAQLGLHVKRNQKVNLIDGAVTEIVTEKLFRTKIGHVHLKGIARHKSHQFRIIGKYVPNNTLSSTIIENRHLGILKDVVADTVVSIQILNVQKQLGMRGGLEMITHDESYLFVLIMRVQEKEEIVVLGKSSLTVRMSLWTYVFNFLVGV